MSLVLFSRTDEDHTTHVLTQFRPTPKLNNALDGALPDVDLRPHGIVPRGQKEVCEYVGRRIPDWREVHRDR